MTASTVASPASRPDLPRLTSLRFFAAAWVLGLHILPRSAAASPWTTFWNAGWAGVTFFFVLSGFILSYTYARAGTRLNTRAFWAARFARVYPLYACAMLFAVPQFVHAVVRPLAGVEPPSVARVVGAAATSVVLLQAWFAQYVCVWNCPSWSLSDEAFFYLLFPLLVPLALTRLGRRALLTIVVAWIAALTAAATRLWTLDALTFARNTPFNPLVRLPEFLAGVWAGGTLIASGRPWTFGAWIAAGAAVLVAALAAVPQLLESGIFHLIALPLFVLVILAVASLPSASGGWLAAPVLVLLGNASYAMYMFQVPVLEYVTAAFRRLGDGAWSPWSVFAGCAVVTVTLAVATHRLIERPARAWLRARFSLPSSRTPA